MTLGLGTKKVQKEDKTSKKKSSTHVDEDEAAKLKKLEDKKDSGECPFC